MSTKEPLIIFLDTSIFRSENFFQGINLKRLYQYSQKGFCKIKITDIVKREFLSQIKSPLKHFF